MQKIISMGWLVFVATFWTGSARASEPPPWPEPPIANEVVQAYFQAAVAEIAEQRDTRNYQTADQWLENKEKLRDQLADMLGLFPEPPRTDLNATIIGSVTRDDIIVQRLHFQSMPGLYVTANLYRPVNVGKPLPGVLYVCGHSRQTETIDGEQISYGNKTGYQRHGAWFARHGYVCLMIDTIQLGEIMGTHHGTYSKDRWDWFSSGYTPAGVEAWNGIRAIDYLQSLPEVDGERIGMTGRSGGGAYSWFTAAMDERIQVVAPVAGITDLENYVVDDCITGHCDCMFFVNYHQWDYPTLAAMIAPRPLLIANSDRDNIFPLDGVLRTAGQVKHVYELLGAGENLGLMITPGPHLDTPELQVGAFRWFDRHLRDLDVPINEAATERFDRTELRVFEAIPDDQRITTADEVFAENLRRSDEEGDVSHDKILQQLRERSFAGWPQDPEPLESGKLWSQSLPGREAELWQFTSQAPWQLRAVLLRHSSFSADQAPVRVHLVDDAGWQRAKRRASGEDGEHPIEGLMIYVSVRGVGPHAWTGSEKDKTHVKRRFYLIGQTLEGMQIWDAIRGIEFAKSRVDSLKPKIEVTYDDAMQGIAAYATALCNDPSVTSKATRPVDYARKVPLLGQDNVPGLDKLFK